MTIKEGLRLAHREFKAYRVRSVAAVVTVGILFGLLLGGLMAWQGLEDVALKYAREATENGVDYNCRDEAVQNPNATNTVYGVCRFFQKGEKDWVRPVSIALVVVGVIILAFTMAHIVAQDAGTFVLYRAIGASKGQIFVIYLMYLLEICVYVVVFAVGLGMALAGIVTVVGWDYLSASFAEEFPNMPQHMAILWGWSGRCTEVVGLIFGMAPVAFLLCLDQFSEKKMVLRLKDRQ